jgi:hypothetical protein
MAYGAKGPAVPAPEPVRATGPAEEHFFSKPMAGARAPANCFAGPQLTATAS